MGQSGQEDLNFAVARAGVALAASRNVDELSELTVTEAQNLVGCDGAVFYVRVDKDPTTQTDDVLEYRALGFRSLGIALGGKSGEPVPVDPVPMFVGAKAELFSAHVVVHVAHSRETVEIADVYESCGFDVSDFKAFDKEGGYRTKTVLTLPLLNQQGFCRGVLQLINWTDPDTGMVGAFPRTSVEAARVIAAQAGVALDNILVSEQLINTGIALSSEKNSSKLLEMILLEAKFLANADGGTLYLRTEDDHLEFAIVRNDTLNIALGGTTGQKITFPPLSLYDSQTGQPNHKNVATSVALTGETINIEDAYNATGYDFSGTKKFDEGVGYRSRSFLTVPLKNYEAEVIGVLQLINAMDMDGKVVSFGPAIGPGVEALASQAAVALDNQKLIEAQRALTDSFTKVIAGAIDAKSPYTGGHCQRVPAISKRLAEAVVAQTEGPYKDFHLNEEEWYELHMASWLHDCGKVTTPEYVVDKSTKLETINNRIHEVRTRFEVLRRDAEIEYWTKRVEGGNEADLKAALDARIAELDEQFNFVATCNVGGEFFDDAKVARLKEIGAQTWTRNYDLMKGLSTAEELRFGEDPPPPAPAVETLLQDRPDHKIYLEQGVGEPKYNHGEVYNLSIARGTLTTEEREVINDHVVLTIEMLEELPFPKNLKRVPEYAGAHHEKMDGTGYPRGLKADQMSIPARIMAIADIYEALTACDRPYKKAKTLSEAIRIMSFMKKDNHIDGQLFELFLTSGAYKDYAEEFLQKSQIDEVDISQYVTQKAAS